MIKKNISLVIADSLIAAIFFVFAYIGTSADNAVDRLLVDSEGAASLSSKSSVLEFFMGNNPGYTCFEVVTEKSDNRYECLLVSDEELEAYDYVIEFTEDDKLDWFTGSRIFFFSDSEDEINEEYEKLAETFSGKHNETEQYNNVNVLRKYIGNATVYQTYEVNGQVHAIFISRDLFGGQYKYIGYTSFFAAE